MIHICLPLHVGNGNYIKQSNAHVHLELHFQAGETWTNQITNINVKAYKRSNIPVLRYLKHVIDRNSHLKTKAEKHLMITLWSMHS